MSVVANACWTASDNERLFLSSPIDDKERAKLVKGGLYSGLFKVDFVKNCALLGVVPHPALINKRPRTVAEEEQADIEEAAERERRAGQGDAPPAVEPTPPPAAVVAPPVAAAPAAAGAKKGGSAGPVKPGRQPSAEKLTPAQRAAAELAAATAALSPEELKPLEQLQVRGWELDVGTAAALQLTIPLCKSLHTLRFWNASLSPRAITLLQDSLKGSAVTKIYLDYNPLEAEKGQEPGLVYSVLLAPSSPLQVLSLRGNRIDDTVASEIAKTIAASKNLVVLDLFDNLITDEGAKAFARTLGLNQTLHSLNLGRNRIKDSGSSALAQAFQSVTILDKEEAKTLKKAGFKITTVKNRTMREANQLLKMLNLSHNYIGEAGLKSWLTVQEEQIKYTPAKGLINVDGQDILASSLVPQRLLPQPEKKVDEVPPPAVVSPRKPSRTAARAGDKDGPGSPKAVDKAAEAAAKAAAAAAAQAQAALKKQQEKDREEEEMRYPGQINNLQQVDLTRQYSRTSELTWFQLLHSPLLRWSASSTADVWDEEGTLDVRAIDEERAERREAVRVANQTDEERQAEAATKVTEAAQLVKEREEALAAQAEAAAATLAKEKEVKKSRKAKKAE